MMIIFLKEWKEATINATSIIIGNKIIQMTNLIKEEDLDKKIIERFITSQLTSRLIKEETDSQVLEEVWL